MASEHSLGKPRSEYMRIHAYTAYAPCIPQENGGVYMYSQGKPKANTCEYMRIHAYAAYAEHVYTPNVSCLANQWKKALEEECKDPGH